MENSEFKFEDHFKPVANLVILQPEKNYKSGDITESGILIARGDFKSSTPESDVPHDINEMADKFGFKVVAIGDEVKRTAVNNVVCLLPGSQFFKMKLFGDDYMVTYDYYIMANLSTEADELNYKLNKEADERHAAVLNVKTFNSILGAKD
jgi:hypothetical protein